MTCPAQLDIYPLWKRPRKFSTAGGRHCAKRSSQAIGPHLRGMHCLSTCRVLQVQCKHADHHRLSCNSYRNFDRVLPDRLASIPVWVVVWTFSSAVSAGNSEYYGTKRSNGVCEAHGGAFTLSCVMAGSMVSAPLRAIVRTQPYLHPGIQVVVHGDSEDITQAAGRTGSIPGCPLRSYGAYCSHGGAPPMDALRPFCRRLPKSGENCSVDTFLRCSVCFGSPHVAMMQCIPMGGHSRSDI